jgi:hypothetical protein
MYTVSHGAIIKDEDSVEDVYDSIDAAEDWYTACNWV